VAPSPGVKKEEHEAHYSPPFSAEVKNAWSYTSTRLHDVLVLKADTSRERRLGRQGLPHLEVNMRSQFYRYFFVTSRGIMRETTEDKVTMGKLRKPMTMTDGKVK
jgi:hypothetical protein